MKNKHISAWSYNTSLHSVEQSSVSHCEINANEILLENEIAGINPVDWKFIHSNPLNWEDGHTPGVDGVGRVVKVGKNVSETLLGQRVAFHQSLKKQGSFARFSVLNAGRVMKVPKSMSSALAGALPCPMLTAWQAFSKIPVKADRNVLIVGVGAVSKIVIQLLSEAGFNVDVLSKSLSIEMSKALGVLHLLRAPEEITLNYHAIFDAVGQDSASRFVKHLKANGHIVAIQDRIDKPLDPPFTRSISYHEIALGALHDYGDSEDWTELMKAGEQLMELISSNQMIIDEPVVFSFDQLPQALEHSEKTKRKTVVKID
ncbi:alcohol dehydrogenase catalytic domain-containing protein [Psychromonas arctica]|uniref:alcohol dehydrogenase catalytic domain-containing protein n=1 Tax=Psychromonas arctica TaxID=168275 RepID=UPI000407D818|nr:alcohol dehydrogenase catalytic domain-containing protein [Psychromonas arctica]